MKYTIQIEMVTEIDDAVPCDLWATVTVEYTPTFFKILDAEIPATNYSKDFLIGYLELYHTERLKATAHAQMLDEATA